MQIHCQQDLKTSIEYLRQGLEEVPVQSSLWEGYFYTSNLILSDHVEEHSPTDFYLEREALLGKKKNLNFFVVGQELTVGWDVRIEPFSNENFILACPREPAI